MGLQALWKVEKIMQIQNEKGFTLIEAVIVLVIIAILAGAFGTAMARWIPANRFNSYVLDLQGAVQQARLEAVKRNTDVSFQLDKTEGAFSVYLDNDDSGDLNAGDTNITTCPAPNGVVFTSLFESGLDAFQFNFNSRGFSDMSGKICLKNAEETYKGIQLTLAGSSRIIRSSDGSNWQ